MTTQKTLRIQPSETSRLSIHYRQKQEVQTELSNHKNTSSATAEVHVLSIESVENGVLHPFTALCSLSQYRGSVCLLGEPEWWQKELQD